VRTRQLARVPTGSRRFISAEAIADLIDRSPKDWHLELSAGQYRKAKDDQPQPDFKTAGEALASYLPGSATRLCNFLNLERETRLELATPTLARSCSTN
jgi:hypothetical protein